MNNFIREINGSKNNNVEYTDTFSSYIEKFWDVLDKTEIVGENLCQG